MLHIPTEVADEHEGGRERRHRRRSGTRGADPRSDARAAAAAQLAMAISALRRRKLAADRLRNRHPGDRLRGPQAGHAALHRGRRGHLRAAAVCGAGAAEHPARGSDDRRRHGEPGGDCAQPVGRGAAGRALSPDGRPGVQLYVAPAVADRARRRGGAAGAVFRVRPGVAVARRGVRRPPAEDAAIAAGRASLRRAGGAGRDRCRGAASVACAVGEVHHRRTARSRPMR